MPTPAQVLAALLAADPASPRLTFYDDTPGATAGERIELSGRVLANWVAKAANALQDEYDVGPGSLVRLDLPSPHWRQAYWALATWAVGATLDLDAGTRADLVVTTDPAGAAAADADEVVVVTLPALSRAYGTELPTGVMDEARELSTYGDRFEAWATPEPGQAALLAHGERTAYDRVVPQGQWPAGCRALVTDADPGTALRDMLAAWAVGGSVVLVRGDPAADDARLAAEGVDVRATERR